MSSMIESSGALSRREIVKKAVAKSSKIKSVPSKITDDFLARVARAGLAFTTSPDPYEAAEQIREEIERGAERIAYLPLEHRIASRESNAIVKEISPVNYLYLDSAPVLRGALRLSQTLPGAGWDLKAVPAGFDIDKVTRLTDKIAQMSGMYPYFLIRAAVNRRGSAEEKKKYDVPIGFYWMTPRGCPVVVTWFRSLGGHELYAAYKKGKFGLSLDKEFYGGGDTMKVTVPSHTKKRKVYDFWLVHLPIFRENDRRQHSYWRRLHSTDNNPDAGYRGRGHKKRGSEDIFFLTRYAVAGFDASGDRLRRTHELGEGLEFRVNPFPQLTPEGRKLVKFIRENLLVAGNPANMTEADRIMGADTVNGKYDNNFSNWNYRNVA